MKFKIRCSDLRNRVLALGKAVNLKSAQPILSSFLFELDGAMLVIKASDSEVYAASRPIQVDTDNQEKVQFLIESSQIISSIKEIPEQEIIFEINNNNMVSLLYENGRFNMPCNFDVEYYPNAIPLREGAVDTILSAEVLRKAITCCIPFTAADDLRPCLCCINFHFLGERLNFVSTDGHQLIRLTLHKPVGLDGMNFLLSRVPAKLVIDFMGKQMEDIKVSFDSNRVIFELKEYILNVRQENQRFPNYQAVIPYNGSNIAVARRYDLLSAVKRVLVFSNTSSLVLSLDFKAENQMMISGQDTDFSIAAEEMVPLNYSGEPMTIGLKGSLLQNILQIIGTDEIQMEMSNPQRAVIFRPTISDDNLEYLALQMPMCL